MESVLICTKSGKHIWQGLAPAVVPALTTGWRQITHAAFKSKDKMAVS